MSDSLLSFGPGGSRRFARNTGRSITGDGVGAIRYPSPFFDIAHTYLPTSYKQLLKWCRYYFITNPLINAVCYKMAEYPVTDLIFDTDNDELHNKWSFLFNDVLHFKKFEVETGLDYNAYGNCFISPFFPFIKFLVCRSCGQHHRVDKTKYTFREFRFHGECSRCHHFDYFNARDHFVRSVRDIRLIRWNPEQMHVQHNEATGESHYYYTISSSLANDIRMGKKDVIQTTPQVFFEALRKNKSLVFAKNNLFHLKRPTLAQKDKGWGLPMILPVLKDSFYLQILRKAQEAIAIEHIVPLRVLFPQTASGSADVYSTINISNWKTKTEQEILRWRLDNNYIPVLPIPIGQQTLGGDGRALMLAQEYRVWAEHIIAGMGVPVEFVFGGMQYSGSNVSMRILENHFLDYKTDHEVLVQQFLMPQIGAFLGWKPVDTHFRKFKMADDLQRSAYNLQLNQSGKLSDHSLLEETDWDNKKEVQRIGKESAALLENQRRQALSQAEIQGEAQLIMQKYQVRAQKLMEENMPQQPGMGGPMEEGMEMMPAGIPGQASPSAMGNEMIMGQAQQLAAGQTEAPPLLPPELLQQMQAEGGAGGGVPQEMQSPIGQGQQIPGAAQEGGAPGEFSVDMQAGAVGVQAIAKRISSWLNQIPDAERQGHLVQIQRNNPQLYSFVAQYLSEKQGAHQSSSALPMPEQRGARRGPEAQSQ